MILNCIVCFQKALASQGTLLGNHRDFKTVRRYFGLPVDLGNYLQKTSSFSTNCFLSFISCFIINNFSTNM